MIGAQTARDPAQPAADLMRHVYGDGRGFVAIFTGRRMDDRLEDPQTQFYEYPDQLDAATAWALAESGRGREAYFCAHLLTDRRRVKENAAEVLALWGDLDGCEIPNGQLSPTALVESSPGNYHGYWKLTRPIPPAEAERLNQRLAREIGADSSGFDLTQLLRVPGTTNHKRETPHAVELRSVSEAAPYTPADLDALLPALPAAEPRPRAGGFGEPPVRLVGRAREVWDGDHPKIKEGRIDRNASLLKIGRAVYDAGGERQVLVEALRERDDALYRKFTGRADADTRYHEMVDELESNGRPEARPATLTAVPDAEPGDGGEDRAPAFNLTDYGLAERIKARSGDDLRHVAEWGRDLVYDGARFNLDRTGEAVRLTKQTVRATYAEAADEPDDGRRKALADFARRSESKAKMDAGLALARSEPGIAITHEELDRDPYLLNVLNGTLDLRRRELRAHDRADHITKLAPVEYRPGATAPTFEKFLAQILPSEALRAFVQRMVGYALTGDVSEQALFFLYGTGSNGKSTLINTLMLMLGDYAKQAAPDLLVVKRGSHPTELADLFGARFVASTEVEDGRRLAESLVKQLTGGEPIRARRMREDFWEFAPTHKVLFSANHKPIVRGQDHAIWRRIKVVPFEVTIPDTEQDKRLPEKLREELPGILAWAVEGCAEWRRHGLGEPPEVKEATETYRAEQDVIGAFVDECCVIRPGTQVRFKELYAGYAKWCEDSGETAINRRQFGDALKERGFEPDRGTGNAPIRRGIGLLADARDAGGGWTTP